MAASPKLQLPVAGVLVLALALLLQCLGNVDSNSCAPEAASDFTLDVSNDEASLMQLSEKVVRRRLLHGGADVGAVADKVDAVADRATWNTAAEEAANASVASSSAASRATNTNPVAAPSNDAVSDSVVPSTPIWLPHNLAAAPTNDAVMAAFVNTSLQQDSATDPQPKSHPQLAAKMQGVPNWWHEVAFVAKASVAQKSGGIHAVIFVIVGVTLVFLFFRFCGGIGRSSPRNIEFPIQGRVASPQPKRQAAVQQPLLSKMLTRTDPKGNQCL